MQVPEKEIVWIKNFMQRLELVDFKKQCSQSLKAHPWKNLESQQIQYILQDTIDHLKKIIDLELFKNTSHRFFTSLMLHLGFCDNQLTKLLILESDEIHDQHIAFMDEILCLNRLMKDSGLICKLEFSFQDMKNSLYEIVEQY